MRAGAVEFILGQDNRARLNTVCQILQCFCKKLFRLLSVQFTIEYLQFTTEYLPSITSPIRFVALGSGSICLLTMQPLYSISVRLHCSVQYLINRKIETIWPIFIAKIKKKKLQQNVLLTPGTSTLISLILTKI